MEKKTNVTLRLPKPIVERVRRVAKIAGVTPTQVYVVLLAYSMEAARERRDGDERTP
jgi:hypothetical protein